MSHMPQIKEQILVVLRQSTERWGLGEERRGWDYIKEGLGIGGYLQHTARAGFQVLGEDEKK